MLESKQKFDQMVFRLCVCARLLQRVELFPICTLLGRIDLLQCKLWVIGRLMRSATYGW